MCCYIPIAIHLQSKAKPEAEAVAGVVAIAGGEAAVVSSTVTVRPAKRTSLIKLSIWMFH